MSLVAVKSPVTVAPELLVSNFFELLWYSSTLPLPLHSILVSHTPCALFCILKGPPSSTTNLNLSALSSLASADRVICPCPPEAPCTCIPEEKHQSEQNCSKG